MKLYLCGAISGDRLFKHKFRDAEDRLKAKGFQVLNPVDLNVPSDVEYWQTAMKQAIKLMMDADAIAVINDVYSIASTGMRVELNLAHAIGMTVRVLEQWISGNDKSNTL